MASRQQSTGKDHAAAPPRVPKGSRVYAIGDIHGHVDLLAALHEKILEDAAKARARRKVLVYLGDYVDRGPGSFEVIDMLIEAPLDGFEIVHLKGNHEDFLLGFLDDPSLILDWFLNGAGATLESYRVPLLDLPYAWEEPDALRLAFRDALPQRHLEFYQSLERFHVEGDYLFVHAGVRPGVRLRSRRTRTCFGSAGSSSSPTPISATWWCTATARQPNPTCSPTASASIPGPITPTA